MTTADPLIPRCVIGGVKKADEIYNISPTLVALKLRPNSEGMSRPPKLRRTHADGANIWLKPVAPTWWHHYVARLCL